MGILKSVFIITLLLLFPLGETIRLPIYREAVVTPNDIGVILIAGFWFLLQGKRSMRKGKLKSSIFIFVAIALVSLIVNSTKLTHVEFLVSFSYLLRWMLYAAIYFVVLSLSKEFRQKIVFLMSISGGVIVAGGYIQYFLYPNLRNLYYLEWDEHLYRMFSSFLDPNFAGIFFVLYLTLLLGLLIESARTKVSLYRVFIVPMVILTIIALFLTFSRSAFIGLLVGASVFFLLMGKRRWLIVFPILVILFFALTSKYFYIENINPFRTSSSQARIDTAKNALKVIADQPILGVGFNTYRYTQIRYGFRIREDAIRSHADAGVDNSFLFILATTGIVGFIAYCSLLFKILRGRWISCKDRKDLLKAVTLASFAAILASGLFINVLFYPFIMFWLWMLVGLTENT